MALKIENRFHKRIHCFNVEKNIKKLLQIVPAEHLIGLERIIIVDEIQVTKKRRFAGSYREKQRHEPSTIELSVNSIYRGMPKIFFYLPFISRFTLADILYHEIGHHYHHKFKHGVNKKTKENFADNYSKEMLNKAFWFWKLIFLPITPLVRYLSKNVSKSN